MYYVKGRKLSSIYGTTALEKNALASESRSLFTVRRYVLHGICYSNSVCPSVTLVDCVHTVRPRRLSGDTTVNDLGHISRSLDSFTSNFSKTMCDTAKVTIDN